MSDNREQSEGRSALEGMHKLMLEALRHREQEIFQYLIILGPALGGFVWLYSAQANIAAFVSGTMGVLLLLLLGAVYSLSLGYNFRYIILELAKMEAVLGIKEAMLVGWPRNLENFKKRHTKFGQPWCEPPEIIKIFWLAFLIGIAGVMVTIFAFPPLKHMWLILFTGVACFLIALLLPFYFGKKLNEILDQEIQNEVAKRVWEGKLRL